MTATESLPLASVFPPASRDRWLALVANALRVDPSTFDTPDDALAHLRTTTYDGITIEPLYTGDDAADAPSLTTREGAWDIRQVVDPAAGDGVALAELEGGATALQIALRHVDTVDAELLDRLLDGVLLDIAPVVLDAGPRWPEAAAALDRLLADRAVAPGDAAGSYGADPFGEHASTPVAVDLAAQLDALATWARRATERTPRVRTVLIDGARYHDAGASDALELGLTVAAAVATLRELVDGAADLDIDAATTQIELGLAATADQFATIAKFRAIRRLWTRVTEVAGATGAAGMSSVSARTSLAMTSRYDAAVNMLRATVACFGAAIGGADAITVRPFDAVSAAVPSELGRRLARNTQSILALESHLGEVADAAGGSWFVEQLTDAIAEAAWVVVQDIDAAGGFRAAVESGLIGSRIAAVRERRDADIDHRRYPLTGVSEFPNGDEAASAASPHEEAAENALPLTRWAERFEALRARVDDYVAAGNARPAVHLATLGTPAEFTPRATFAANFYGIAGLAPVAGPVEEFSASGAQLACVCSSDNAYGDGDAAASEAVAALTAAGAARVDIAGRGAVTAGADARTALTDILELLQIQ